ncbi:ribonuclease H-like domain-containing protein, partial [Dipodascopsis tothii]|uniref:ribonuclease H-like domain-containing protein n=1 Tax=Dipodascopsis tothii TaxID=44089 RepID=UPI0034CF70EF
MDAQSQEIFNAAVGMTRAAARLAAADPAFHRSIDANFGRAVDGCIGQLLALTNKVADAVCGADAIESVDELADNWKTATEVLDYLFEKTDTYLDDFVESNKPRERRRGNASRPLADIARVLAPVVAPAAPAPAPAAPVDQGRRGQIERVQDAWSDRPDTSRGAVFKPLLQTKPHATVPLAEALVLESVPQADGTTHLRYRNPYEREISEYQPPAYLYKPAMVRAAVPLPAPVTWVDTDAGLAEMHAVLRAATEIAIDLEHHDLRTYYGLVCLMQVSTRERDFVVDPLALHGKLHVLNDVFTDPAVLKIFHGGRMDIQWLQRDLGLYVVGMADTYFLSRELELEKNSLAFLLERYVGFKASKKYQMVDWRRRPLTGPMLHYAQGDTHYLFELFERLKNEVLATRGAPSLTNALEEARKYALQTYEHPSDAAQADRRERVAAKFELTTPLQLRLLDALWALRDEIARQADESPAYVATQAGLNLLVRQQPVTVEDVV